MTEPEYPLMDLTPTSDVAYAIRPEFYEHLDSFQRSELIRLLLYFLTASMTYKTGLPLETVKRYPAYVREVIDDLVEGDHVRLMIAEYSENGHYYNYVSFYSGWSLHDDVFIFYKGLRRMMLLNQSADKLLVKGIFMYDYIERGLDNA